MRSRKIKEFYEDVAQLHETATSSLRNPLIFNDLIYQPIPGDDHCLYNAVGLYCGQDQQTLRNIVSGRIRFNFSEYQDLISSLEGSNGRTIDEYLRDVETGKEWVDNIEIAILMKILDRPIIIVEANNIIRNLSNIEMDGELMFSGEPIFVYYNGHNHYDALIKEDQTISGKDIFNKLKQGGVNIHREKSHKNEGIPETSFSSSSESSSTPPLFFADPSKEVLPHEKNINLNEKVIIY